jgi:hypothetical protein
MKRIITLNESDINRIIKRTLMEQDSVETTPTETIIKAKIFTNRGNSSKPFTYIDINTSSIKLDDSSTLAENNGFSFDFTMAGTTPVLKGYYYCYKHNLKLMEKLPMELVNLGKQGKLYLDFKQLEHREIMNVNNDGSLPSDLIFTLSEENKQKMNSYCKNLKRVDLEDYSSTNNTKTQQMTERDLSRIVKRTISELDK